MTVVNVAEKLSVLVQDVDTMVDRVCGQNPTMAVSSDAAWYKWSLPSRATNSVGKAEVPVLINHYYSTGFVVRHADI